MSNDNGTDSTGAGGAERGRPPQQPHGSHEQPYEQQTPPSWGLNEDADATAFVQLPPDLADFRPEAGASSGPDTPLAAPGTGQGGYTPPPIDPSAPMTPAASVDPSSTGEWVLPYAMQSGQEPHDGQFGQPPHADGFGQHGQLGQAAQPGQPSPPPGRPPYQGQPPAQSGPYGEPPQDSASGQPADPYGSGQPGGAAPGGVPYGGAPQGPHGFDAAQQTGAPQYFDAPAPDAGAAGAQWGAAQPAPGGLDPQQPSGYPAAPSGEFGPGGQSEQSGQGDQGPSGFGPSGQGAAAALAGSHEARGRRPLGNGGGGAPEAEADAAGAQTPTGAGPTGSGSSSGSKVPRVPSVPGATPQDRTVPGTPATEADSPTGHPAGPQPGAAPGSWGAPEPVVEQPGTPEGEYWPARGLVPEADAVGPLSGQPPQPAPGSAALGQPGAPGVEPLHPEGAPPGAPYGTTEPSADAQTPDDPSRTHATSAASDPAGPHAQGGEGENVEDGAHVEHAEHAENGESTAAGFAVGVPPEVADAASGADEAAADAPQPDAVDSEHPHVSYVLRVNGVDRPVTESWIGESLLYVLRERLGLAGAKDGCAQGECGACSVQVDGRLVASCLVPAATTAGSEVRTVEGLATDGAPSDVQRALAEGGSVQCGFCVPGLAMTVHDLLERNHRPSELEVRQAISGNLCRCSGYRGVLDAVHRIVEERTAAHEAAEEEPTRGQETQAAQTPHIPQPQQPVRPTPPEHQVPPPNTRGWEGGSAPGGGPQIPHQAPPGAGGAHPGYPGQGGTQ